VTVTIPCRDAGPFLEPLIESLLAQTFSDFRLVLVDDASRDDSVAVARKVAGDRIDIHRHDTPRGIAGNWNYGANLAETTYFCLAHQDDIYHPEFLARLVDALERTPLAGMAHCRSAAIDARGAAIDSGAERYKQHFWRRLAVDDHPAQYRRLWCGNWICCPAVVYRTAAWQQVGEFRSDLSFALDWEYWFRMLRSGHGIVDVDDILLDHRRHLSAVTATATSNCSRFAEELDVLNEAKSTGISSGLLPHGCRPSPALRNNLLHEALTDIELGNREAAAAKLDFVRQNAPELWHNGYVRMFRALLKLGPVGHTLLGVGRQFALRYGFGGAAG